MFWSLPELGELLRFWEHLSVISDRPDYLRWPCYGSFRKWALCNWSGPQSIQAAHVSSSALGAKVSAWRWTLLCSEMILVKVFGDFSCRSGNSGSWLTLILNYLTPTEMKASSQRSSEIFSRLLEVISSTWVATKVLTRLVATEVLTVVKWIGGIESYLRFRIKLHVFYCSWTLFCTGVGKSWNFPAVKSASIS